MRLVLVADAFPPMRTSGAVQLRDLSREFCRQGHDLTVILPDSDLGKAWKMEVTEGVRILRLRAPKTKDIGYVRRTLGELSMPFFMRMRFRKTPLAKERWGGVVWYSPSIFHGPFVKAIKSSSRCKGYLIVRDLFPEWAADMGLMARGLPYFFFRAVASYQYAAADIIGVQTKGNKQYFSKWVRRPKKSLEVLNNWLDKPAQVRCRIRVCETGLAGRKIFVYAGNMGVAQGMGILLDLAHSLRDRTDLGFLFVGRGSDVEGLKLAAQRRRLENVIFFDEIHPDEIPDLYAQCAAGLVALDHRHKAHNIPGKFLTYMQCGLPVLANVNFGNDLAELMRKGKVGRVCESNQLEELFKLAEILLQDIASDPELPARCRQLFTQQFSVEKTVSQLVSALSD